MKNSKLKKMSLVNMEDKLTFAEMENIMAGSFGWNCGIAGAAFVFGTVGVVAGGPLTWWGVGGTVALWANFANSCA